MPLLSSLTSLLRLPKLVPSLGLLAFGLASGVQAHAADVQFIILSDVHFGYIRKFPVPSASTTKDALTINQAMAASVNLVSGMSIPNDGGVGAGTTVGPIDLVAVTGDMANRDESGDGVAAESANQVQNATASWGNFNATYLTGLTLKNPANANTPFLLSPGNHDISNSIGQQFIIPANIDDDSMRQLLAIAQGTAPITAGTYTQAFFQQENASGAFVNKPNYSMDIGGIHFVSISAWPDSGSRKWIDANLAAVPLTTPVILFTHCYPDVDPKLLAPPSTTSPYSTIPGAPTAIGAANDYEAVVSDVIDSTEFATSTSTNVEQTAMANWIKSHPNIVAYFHGHTNFNEMYQFVGPNHDIKLNCFRIDSPMKGQLSAGASGKETLLSFQLATVNTTTWQMTVREIRWYPTPVFSTDTTTANPDTGPNSTFTAVNVPMENVQLAVAAPTFSVAAGAYTSTQSVALACATPATNVYYTTDGTTPTTSSALYSAPLSISATTTVKALAVTNSFASMAASTSAATYTITAASATTSAPTTTGASATAGTTTAADTTSSSDGHHCGSGSILGMLLGLALVTGRRFMRRQRDG
jgi:hypothetical protein